jgi:hypothetical protein
MPSLEQYSFRGKVGAAVLLWIGTYVRLAVDDEDEDDGHSSLQPATRHKMITFYLYQRGSECGTIFICDRTPIEIDTATGEL